MKIITFSLILASIVLTNGRSAEAADLNPSVRPSATRTVMVPARPRARVYIRRKHVVYRTIGMPCVLPPHAIVQLNWNGPQCRWVDNVIPGDLRLAARVARWR